MFKTWFLETRPQFLLLSVLLVVHGTMLALWQGASVSWWHAVLAALGLMLLHGSVNVLNDWHDFAKTGIDLRVRRTPFSGGSGLLPAGTMSANGALVLGVSTLGMGSAIGIYLASVSGAELLVIGIVGALSVVLYTPVFNRLYLGEFFAGLALGTLPVLGTYFLFTGYIDEIAWVSAVPAGLLTYNLLLLNEFPDVDADLAGGRRHMVTLLEKKRARWLYSAVEILVYLAIVAGVLFDGLTPWALLGLGGSFFAFKAIAGAMRDYDSHERTVPALGANVAAVLSTNALLSVGYLIATVA